jgi:hypothetical protein
MDELLGPDAAPRDDAFDGYEDIGRLLVNVAVASEQLHIVRWYTTRLDYNRSEALMLALRTGNTSIISCVSNHIDWTTQQCQAAIASGAELGMDYGLYRFDDTEMLALTAARYGNLSALQLLCDAFPHTRARIVANRQLSMARWAAIHNCLPHVDSAMCASIHGHVHILQWLWDTHREVIEWNIESDLASVKEWMDTVDIESQL